MKYLKIQEEHKIVNFSDLDKNWDVERVVNKKYGKESYMVVDGVWTQSLPTQSNYHRHIYATPEEIEELNTALSIVRASENKYKKLLAKYK